MTARVICFGTLQKVVLITLLVIAVSGALFSVTGYPAPAPSKVEALALVAPSLQAESVLWHEAGLTAYDKLVKAPDLAAVAKKLKVVETRSQSHVSGVLYVSGSRFDPHVYVDSTGLVAAYFRRGELTAIAIDADKQFVLDRALKEVAEASGSWLEGGRQLYHFGYPESHWVTFAVETMDSGFEINVPGSVSILEASAVFQVYSDAYRCKFSLASGWTAQADAAGLVVVPPDVLSANRWQAVTGTCRPMVLALVY